MLKGIGASSGIGIGKALKFIEKSVDFEPHTVADTNAEKTRFENAVSVFKTNTEALAEKMDKTGADGEILRGHIAMISDPYMISQINEQIENGNCAESALSAVCDMFITVFSSADDELTKQRAADVEDIKKRILKILLGIEDINLKTLPENTILIVDELTPSMTAEMDKENIKGIITEKGGKTSHSAIISRSLKIPSVLSVKDALTLIEDGKDIIIDGENGEVYTDFDEHLKQKFIEIQQTYIQKAKTEELFRGKPTVTADGEEKELFANIGSHKDLEAVISGDAEGIGLFRTEFLFMDRTSAPSEEEQFDAYKAVAVGMKGKEVIIRTLDVGGDKEIPYLGLKREENPFLGFRAVRYCLKNSESYRLQLRAILRASAFGNLSIMIPLVTCVDELLQVKEMVSEIMHELDERNIAYKKDIKIGVMIETPAACMIADLLAQHADFFSIGTNDLTGYIMAADRGNSDVEYLYSVFNPAVLRAIKHIISCAKEKGIKCGMCGEAAADEKLIPLLVSFGLNEFSVNPTSVLSVRRKISQMEKQTCDKIAKEVFMKQTANEIESFLKNS
ncbi:MAG: phosphoenolpyruvate--protein phosphotransferase [Acutalibacteraceae bacterium]|nr:phosphoenolpyruvate--protein phosphotransferase [Acutalibacteraceae bacterium]